MIVNQVIYSTTTSLHNPCNFFFFFSHQKGIYFAYYILELWSVIQSKLI